jgi:predicted dehydrogenase
MKIAVGHQYRTHRSSRLLKQIIESGEIGKIARVLWTWMEFRPEKYYTRDIWRSTWEHSGGGVLMNQASHDLDLACWLIGTPVEVSAFIGNQFHDTDVEDVVCANIIFKEGAFGSFQFTVNNAKHHNIRHIEGDHGVIVMPDVQSLTWDKADLIRVGIYPSSVKDMAGQLKGAAEQPKMKWKTISNSENPSWYRRLISPKRFLPNLNGKRKHGLTVLLDDFIDAILNGHEPMVNGRNCRMTVELINAIILSAFKRKSVRIPIDWDEYDILYNDLKAGKTKVPKFFRL